MFAIGDVVQLRSGGPEMTVSQIEQDGRYECSWFDKNHNRQMSAFSGDILRKPTNAPPTGRRVISAGIE